MSVPPTICVSCGAVSKAADSPTGQYVNRCRAPMRNEVSYCLDCQPPDASLVLWRSDIIVFDGEEVS